MAKVRFFIDPIGNTFSLWLKDPREEDSCEISRTGDILSLDKKGQIFGFEKLNFLPEEFLNRLTLESPDKMRGELVLVEKRQNTGE